MVASVSGLVVGGFATHWLGKDAEASTAPAARVAQKAEPQAPGATQPARAIETNKLAQRVADKLGDIEARVERLEEPAAPPDETQEMPAPESYHQRHTETIRQHRAEPVDPDWGPSTTELVNDDLHRLAQFAGVNIREVECRAESCRAVVGWESMGVAMENYQRLVVTPIRVNCGRTILLPEADQVQGAVEATLVFDCAEWKAAGSELLPAEYLPELPAVRQPG
jgi:hypothetical protein